MTAAIELLKRFVPHLLAVAIALAALFGAYRHGVTTTVDRYERQLADMRAQQAAALADAEAKARQAEQAARARIAEIDRKHTEELRHAQAAAERTIADLRADAVRVRERFTCPAPAGGGTQGARGAGLGDAAQGGGLSAQDVELLLREAQRADEVTRQLQAAQDIIRAFQGDQAQ